MDVTSQIRGETLNKLNLKPSPDPKCCGSISHKLPKDQEINPQYYIYTYVYILLYIVICVYIYMYNTNIYYYIIRYHV